MSQKENVINTSNLLTPSSCPHCSSTAIVRNGHNYGKQQYKCKNCSKNFTSTTGTPTHGLHLRHKITKYTEALMLGLSVRKAAQFAEISKNTSFTWRHKFLSSINNEQIIKENAEPCTVAIVKNTYNAKGRKKSPEKIRKDSRTIITINNNQINIRKLDNKPIITQLTSILLGKKLIAPSKNKELTIITKKLPQNQILKHNFLKAKLKEEIVTKVKTLEVWMARFRGVATKYLQQYWNWFCGLHNVSLFKDDKRMFVNQCIINYTLQSYRVLRNI